MMFKQKPIRSKKITNYARGQNCTLKTPVCNNDRETVVACHAPSEVKGMGLKSDDFWVAFGCSECHSFLDTNQGTEAERLTYWFRGINRTLKILFSEGVIKV